MTEKEFFSLKIGRRIYLVNSPIADNRFVEPRKMVRKATVTDLQYHYAWYHGFQAITTGEGSKRRHHMLSACFVGREEAVSNAILRIELAIEELKTLCKAIESKIIQ